MSPDVLARKLRRLSVYLAGLKMHDGRSAEDIDYDIVANSIGPAVEDFGELLRQLQGRLTASE